MPEQRAVYRAIADFGDLIRSARRAKRELRSLDEETSTTQAKYAAGQQEIASATEESAEAHADLGKQLRKTTVATRRAYREEARRAEAIERSAEVDESRLGVLQASVTEIGKMTSAQRARLAAETQLARSQDRLSTAQANYLSVVEDTSASERDRADSLDEVRLATVKAVQAQERLNVLMTRTGGLGGGPPGRGVATDVGSFFRQIQNAAAGLLSFLGLVSPTINAIIAGLVGIIGLLTSAVVGAAAFAAAFIAVGGAMAFAAFRWRQLLSESEPGVQEWKASVLAIEAAAFNAAKRLINSFDSVSESGESMFDSVARAAVVLINEVSPYIERAVHMLANFANAVAGVPGAASPFLDFLRTWGEEWKRLGEIVNQDILPGGPGFFEKYEEPAKAFVEGIAEVINGIRKMSRMGLGLNMEELAQFLRNVFHWLAQVVQIIPRFSNALVDVGLATSEWLNALVPLLDTIFKVGSFILDHLVGPIAEFVLLVSSKLLNLPIVGWLAGLYGGFLLAAFGLSKLSFGLLSFKSIIGGSLFLSIGRFVTTLRTMFTLMVEGNGILASISAAFPRFGGALQKVIGSVTRLGTVLSGGLLKGGIGAFLLGGVGVAGAVYGGIKLVQSALAGLAEIEAKTEEAWDSLMARFAAGNATLDETRERMVETGLAAYHSGSILGRVAFEITHLGETLSGASRQEIIAAEANERLAASYLETSQNATAAVEETGALTAEQVEGLKVLENTAGATQYYNAFLGNLHDSYEDGLITSAQYFTILDQLGVEYDSQGDKVNLLALKVKGASLTISQALLSVEDTAAAATGGLERFARDSGQDIVSFRTDALAAFNDIEGGVLGTGAKVTEFFQNQANFIEQWKIKMADSFNFVAGAFDELASKQKISFEKIKNTLTRAIEAAEEYQENWDQLVRQGASRELLRQIQELGPAGAEVLASLTEGGRSGVREINRLVREGGTLSTTLADSMAESLGLTLERLTATVEVFIAKMLDIPVAKIRRRVNELVNGTNEATDEIIPVEERLAGRAPRGPGSEGPLDPSLLAPPPSQIGNRAFAAWENAGLTAGQGFAAGLSDTEETDDAARGMANSAVAAVRRALKSESPSQVFFDIGYDVMLGFRNGIKAGLIAVVTGMEEVKNRLTPILETLSDVIAEDLVSALDSLGDILGDLPDEVSIGFDMDFSDARDAMNAFLADVQAQGISFRGALQQQNVLQHSGGMAGSGPMAFGPPRSDEVDARLQRGEFVFSKRAVENIGGASVIEGWHDRLRSAKRKFHDGGFVGDAQGIATRSALLRELLRVMGLGGTVAPPDFQLPLTAYGGPSAAGAGTPAMSGLHKWIMDNFSLRGTLFRAGPGRTINFQPGASLSQHAFGNAVDYFGSAAEMMRMFLTVIRMAGSRTIRNLGHAIHAAKSWSYNSQTIGPYSGAGVNAHYDHVHIDALPQWAGPWPGHPIPPAFYRRGGKVKREGIVHRGEWVLTDSAARALGDRSLDFLNRHAGSMGPSAFIEAMNLSLASHPVASLGGLPSAVEEQDSAGHFSLTMVLDGRRISRTVDVYAKEAEILLPAR